jgi:hypothetical protein
MSELPNSPQLFWFRWWYKGMTSEGNVISLQGNIQALDAGAACDQVETQMRAAHPDVAWMQGREVEGIGSYRGVRFGPTVQQMKRGPKS